MLKQIQSSGESHIVLDCSLDKIVPLLRQAAEVKMMEEYQSYIITTLDAHTLGKAFFKSSLTSLSHSILNNLIFLDFAELKYMRANITTMRLVDPKSFEIMNGE